MNSFRENKTKNTHFFPDTISHLIVKRLELQQVYFGSKYLNSFCIVLSIQISCSEHNGNARLSILLERVGCRIGIV